MHTDAEILKEADACVKCGLCLASCPTYGLRLSERESPRGRVALVQGLIQGAIPQAAAWPALDSCLGCGACERACPSGVRVTALVDGIRARRPSLARRLLIEGLAHPEWWLGVARWARRVGLGPLLGLGGALGGLPAGPACDARSRPRDPDLWLFAGCTGRTLDARALRAALKVLGHLDIAAALPSHRLCCGALFRHRGLEGEGARFLEASARVLSGSIPVLSIASACAGELRNHPDLNGRAWEICTFLAGRQDLQPAPLDGRVAVQVPCTQGVGGEADAALRLLARIPGLEVAPLKAGFGCCGAAGTQMLLHSDQARALRTPLIDALREQSVDWLATSNTGCALHLRAGIAEAGLAVRVVHPLELVALALQDRERNEG